MSILCVVHQCCNLVILCTSSQDEKSAFLFLIATSHQGLVNVPIEHHPTIGDIISNRYLFWWCETNPQKGTSIPTPGHYKSSLMFHPFVGHVSSHFPHNQLQQHTGERGPRSLTGHPPGGHSAAGADVLIVWLTGHCWDFSMLKNMIPPMIFLKHGKNWQIRYIHGELKRNKNMGRTY